MHNRDGTDECFQLLSAAQVPVLVFSAGLGDVVKSFMTLRGLLTENVHIISNFFKIVDGKIVGYQNDVIHVFNKNERQIENTPYHAVSNCKSTKLQIERFQIVC